jgi:type IV secretory pathway VirB10-like protein
VNDPNKPSENFISDFEGQRTERLFTRAELPKVVQLSSRVLIGGLCIVSMMIAGAIYWGMQRRKPIETQEQELLGGEQKVKADGLNSLPRDYSGIAREAPKLGPALPGDLGRPMLAAGILPGATLGTTAGTDAETQRVNQEIEAARVSRLFSTGNSRQQSSSPMGTSATSSVPMSPAAQGLPFANDETFAQSGQDRKLAFVNTSSANKMVSNNRLKPVASPFIIQAGTIIPGALITGIRSDLPGEITAQVTENVYDSPSGQALLIPQGSRLIGSYDSQVAFGQSRVLLVWTRMILPNGKSILLDRQKGSDVDGYSGLEDDVNNHWGSLFKAAALSTLLSVGSQVAVGNSNNQLQQAVAQGAALGFNQIGRQIIGRNLNIQPTLTVRPGFPVRVIVNQDLILEAYKEESETQ